MFKHYFKMELTKFLHPDLLSVGVKSFNLIEFDRWLKPPEGACTKDFIKKKYGADAMAIVKALL